MFSLNGKSSGKGITAKRAAAKREADAKRSRIQSAAGRDIGPIPVVANRVRRDAGEACFKVFCQTYFPAIFFHTWCPDQEKAADRIERAVRKGGLFALALPRGFGKTVLTVAAALWATLYGYRRYVVLIGATEGAAQKLLVNIKTHLSTNEMLAADFPEVCAPIRALENDARRCNGQLSEGRKTNIVWSAKQLILPTIENSKVSGSLIAIAGITGRIRGQNHALPDGQVIRPDFVIPDDPQTAESAFSDQQTQKRIDILCGDVLGLGGPGKKIAAVMPCTVIRPGDLSDQMLDRQKHPEWSGVRGKMVYSFPTNVKLWDQYGQIRADSLRADGDGEQATEFYREHRAEMDEGSAVAWADRYDEDEISALQHAMNLKLRDEASFFAEQQNEPLVKQLATDMLSVDRIMGKLNGLARRHLPIAAQKITAFIDVHDTLLYYAVAAWDPETFSGWLIDYGAWPEQPKRYFSMRQAEPLLQTLAPGAGKEGTIMAGLQSLDQYLFSQKYLREDGAEMPIDKVLIDLGYMPEVVFEFIRATNKSATIMGSRGVGIGAQASPMSDYRRKPGETIGNNWLIPKPNGRELRSVRFDSNFYKTKVHDSLALALADKGSLSLYGRSPNEHRLFADHIHAEFFTPTEGRGRKLNDWRIKPNRPDNHLFDSIVGATVAASMVGCGRTIEQKKVRKKIRLSAIENRRGTYAAA